MASWPSVICDYEPGFENFSYIKHMLTIGKSRFFSGIPLYGWSNYRMQGQFSRSITFAFVALWLVSEGKQSKIISRNRKLNSL